MLYKGIMAVSSEIHTKHINTVCGQNVELLLLYILFGLKIIIIIFLSNGKVEKIYLKMENE